MKKSSKFNKAANLRKRGFSLREISERMEISKSTASVWLSKIAITTAGRKRLAKIKENAIIKSKEIIENRKKEYLNGIADNCTALKGNEKYLRNDFKIFLALLFWGEGSKNDRRVVFMNSDPAMVKVYLALLRNSFAVDENKFRATLHLHGYHDKKEMVKFWSNITKIKINNIAVYNKKNSGKRKKAQYKGCISIRYGDVRIKDELFLIIRRFTRYIETSLS